MAEYTTRTKTNVKKMDQKEICQKMDTPAVRESALSYMTKITQQQVQDCGYYFVKQYEKVKDQGKNVSKIQLKRYNPEIMMYGSQGTDYIPYPDEFLLTDIEANRGEGNPKLYQKISFKNTAAYLLYQVYYGNIVPDGYTYDSSKQRVKKL